MCKFTCLILLLCVSLFKCDRKPNFLIVLTDDQDVVLDGMTPMSYVEHYIAKEGATFMNAYTSSPICCPSRASILSGMYLHNHRTVNNSVSGNCYGNHWKSIEGYTFPNIMRNNGYETFYAGKYLNQYGVHNKESILPVPPGWAQWHGLVGNSKYYNYTISSNGIPVFSEDSYLTDVIRDLAIDFLQSYNSEEPFLMFLAPPAPHQPFTPAKRFENYYSNVSVKMTDNFNVVPKDKHWLMNMSPTPLPESTLKRVNESFQQRWESLLAVDEMVYDLLKELDGMAVLNETYIIFTSDNGYHLGQFSQVLDKRQPYETDIKIPLVIRGPNIERKSLIYDPVMNIDLAPTILGLAGLSIPKHMDGKPINFTKNSTMLNMSERFFLVEYIGEHDSGTVDTSCPWRYDHQLSECRSADACKCQDSSNNTYSCIVGISSEKHLKYCRFYDKENFEEMYDLQEDPWEMENVVHTIFPAIRNWYRIMLDKLMKCSGNTCSSHSLSVVG